MLYESRIDSWRKSNLLLSRRIINLNLITYLLMISIQLLPDIKLIETVVKNGFAAIVAPQQFFIVIKSCQSMVV